MPAPAWLLSAGSDKELTTMPRKICPFVLLAAGAVFASGCAGAQKAPDAPETAGPATPGAQAEEGGTELQQSSSRALRHLDEAEGALRSQQSTRAAPSLDAAANELKTLEEGLPGEPLLGLLDKTIADIEADPRSADFTRLRTTTREMEPELDPGVTRAIEDARFALLAGNPEGALTRLRDARMALAADTQRLPVERVRAQLEEIRTLVGNRDVQAASRRLGEAQALLREVRALGPLVPVRWNLRAAANAADDGDWEVAERNLADAVETLREIREPQGPVAAEVESLEAKARTYLQRLDGAQKPTADQLRELASSTLDVRAG
jgi:hypothetical protein